MKTGSWYLMVFVLTFLYFYIYAVNYVRGASVPTSSLQSGGFHPPQTIGGYVTEEVQVTNLLLWLLPYTVLPPETIQGWETAGAAAGPSFPSALHAVPQLHQVTQHPPS